MARLCYTGETHQVSSAGLAVSSVTPVSRQAATAVNKRRWLEALVAVANGATNLPLNLVFC